MTWRLAIIFMSAVLSAATPTNPVRAQTKIICPVVADATYNVRVMNINYTALPGLSTSLDSRNIANVYSNTLTGYSVLDGTYTYFIKDALKLSLEGLAGGMAISGALSQIAANLSAQNTQYRFYAFYLPVSGPYDISVSMPGDPIFRPNNKVELYSGSFNWRWSSELGSDTATTFHFEYLETGPFVLVVGLGTVSTYFHSAGNLNWVRLNSPTYQSWTAKSVVNIGQYDGRTILPTVGGTTQVSFPFLPVPTNPNILDGTVVYSNYSTGSIYQETSYNDSWTWKKGAGRWVEFPCFNSGSSYLTGDSAVYSITRTANEYEWVTKD